MFRWKITATLLIAALVLLGCSGRTASEPTEVVLPTASPTQTLEPSATPTPSPTHTPTSTPTNTPVPTNTPSPTPTATPEGLYFNDTGAFSLIYPRGWEIVEEAPGFVFIAEEERIAFLMAMSDFNNEEETYETVLADMLGQLGDDARVDAEDTIILGDGIEAQRAIVDYKIDDLDATMHLVWVDKYPRYFLLMSWAPTALFGFQADEIDQVYASVELGVTRVFGKNRDETLVLLGGDPFPNQMDPARTTGSAAGYVGHLYSGLVRLSPQMRIEPDLADSWEISGDGTVYTFTLQADLTFQSGEPLQAADVKYSWERAADPETDSPTVKTYLGDIEGVLDKVEGQADEITGVQVVDARTLVVRLDGPKPYFLAKLTYPTSYVVDQENVEADPEDWMFSPNASGPFVLEEFREDEAIFFARNPAYHTPPDLGYVVYLLYRVGNRLSLYEAGEIDLTGLSNTDVVLVQEPDHSLHEELLSAVSMCTSYIEVNNTLPPMDDVLVRQAFAHAVDKEKLNELFNEDLALIADSILPPAMPGFSTDLPGLAYDPEAAQAALAASSYSDGLPPIIISSSGYGELDSPIALALLDTWKETLGAEFEVKMVDPENFIPLIREQEEHIYIGGWCADYPDPENFLDIIFHSGSDFNLVNTVNPDLDALLEAARTELDPAKRLALYHQAEAMILEEGSAIPLWHGIIYTVVNPRVEGYVVSPMGAPVMHLLSLTPEE